MLRVGAISVAVALVALASAQAPLWVYATTLALFGLPHVLVELRYVDERFSGRLPRGTLLWLGVVLLGVAALRTLAFAGAGGSLVRAELALGVGLVAIAAPLLLARANPIGSLLAFAVAGSLLAGVVYAPLPTLVALALLHNLTPVGFLAERLQGRARRRALLAAAVVFFVVPTVLVSAPYLPTVVDGPFATGELSHHLHAFVPAPWIGTTFGERLFAAAAYLQVMHYAVVLGVLPRLGGGDQRTQALAPWPRPRTFAVAVALVTAIAAASFAFDFASARSGYAIFAAVHAWIEIPMLLVACALGPAAVREVRPA
jgi:hypothetical protein